MNKTGGYTPTTQLENLDAPGEKVVSKKELNKKFKCPICGHEKCEYRFNMSAYVCSGCSVIFENIEMFSKQKLYGE